MKKYETIETLVITISIHTKIYPETRHKFKKMRDIVLNKLACTYMYVYVA